MIFNDKTISKSSVRVLLFSFFTICILLLIILLLRGYYIHTRNIEISEMQRVHVNQLRTGDILFFSGHNMINMAYLNTKHYHIGVVFEDSFGIFTGSPGTACIYELNMKKQGVVLYPLLDRLSKLSCQSVLCRQLSRILSLKAQTRLNQYILTSLSQRIHHMDYYQSIFKKYILNSPSSTEESATCGDCAVTFLRKAGIWDEKDSGTSATVVSLFKDICPVGLGCITPPMIISELCHVQTI